MWLRDDGCSEEKVSTGVQVYWKLCRSYPIGGYPTYTEYILAVPGYERWRHGALNQAVLADLCSFQDDGTHWWLEGNSVLPRRPKE